MYSGFFVTMELDTKTRKSPQHLRCHLLTEGSKVHDGRQDVLRISDRPRPMAHHHRQPAVSSTISPSVANLAKTSAIDDMYRAVSDASNTNEQIEEGKKIIEKLAKMKYEVQHDRPLEYVNITQCPGIF